MSEFLKVYVPSEQEEIFINVDNIVRVKKSEQYSDCLSVDFVDGSSVDIRLALQEFVTKFV